MVKLRQDSGSSEDPMPNHQTSCSAEASPDALKISGNPWKTALVNGSRSDKSPVNETPAVNGHSDKMPTKNVPAVNGNSSKTVPAVNGNSSKTVVINEVPTIINGHSNNIPVKKVTTVNGNSYSTVLVNDAPLVNGHSGDEVPAEKVPMVNGKDNDKGNESFLTVSNTTSENGSSSNVCTYDSLCNEDNLDENQHGFIQVVNKKKRNKNKTKNHRKKPSPNLPSGLNTESIRRDNVNDKNCGEKTSPIHLSQKPPTRILAATRSSGKSYSSVLVNGQNGNPPLTNSGPSISSVTQNVTKCTKQNTFSQNSTLPGTTISVDQLSTELTKSTVITDSSPAPCKQCNSSTKVEMTDVSAQTEVCSQNEISPSQKECLSSHEEEINESEKASSPSDYVDVGEISDESSNTAYCDSVVSNDSGRGDSEITYDESMPYCCEFPREKTSQLIGRGGSFRYEIERKSGIKLWVYSLEYDKVISIVCMTGTGAQIEKAKQLIKNRFPHVTLRQWLGFNPINPPLSEKYLPILPEGTDFMGVVSCICDPNFFWLQQYGHPHLYSLEDLERRMTDHFSTVPDAPGIENPTIGSVIAVPGVRDGDNVKWIRGWVINIIPEDEKVVVRYLDHGGDHLVPIGSIRPMRHDFFSMPFFAAQSCLYDILPTGGVWSDEARAEFTRLCNSSTCPPIVRVVYKTPDCYFVTMFGYDSELNAQVDIASQLISKGFGVRPCLPATEFPSELQQ